MLGASTANERMPLWNVALAPIVLPMALGRGVSLIIEKINNK